MPAPLIDKRSYGDLVAWTQRLASCGRAAPGPGLAGAIVAADVVDPATGGVLVPAGTALEGPWLEALGKRQWVVIADLLAGPDLPVDVANPATGRTYPAGTP